MIASQDIQEKKVVDGRHKAGHDDQGSGDIAANYIPPKQNGRPRAPVPFRVKTEASTT